MRAQSTPLHVVIAVFVASRVAAFAAGVRFDDGLLHNAYQLLDGRLLRDNPVESIYYLHSQPPLFNALTALVVQLPHGAINTALALAWHAAGLATAVALFATMTRLGVRPWLAAGLGSLFVISPAVLLTESWFFYTQPEMLLIALALLGLARFATSRRTFDGLLFSGSLAALVLLRSSFHPVLLVALLVIVWRVLHLGTRRLTTIAVIPLVLVGAWSVKNVLVFDSWSNSTWLGMNLAYVAHAGTTPQRCRELVAEHTVDGLACTTPFRAPAKYRNAVPHPHRYGVDATDLLHKSTGQPNFNASLYIDVAAKFQHDSLELLRDGGPTAIARAELAAYTVWAEPGDDVLQLRKVRAPIAAYADWFDRIVLLRPVATGWNDPARFTAGAGGFPIGDALGSLSYTLLAMFGLAVYGGVAGWRRGKRGDSALQVVCAVSLVLLGYSTVLGNALDFRENNRFRLETAPGALLLAAIGIELIVERLAARRARSEATAASPTPAAQVSAR